MSTSTTSGEITITHIACSDGDLVGYIFDAVSLVNGDDSPTIKAALDNSEVWIGGRIILDGAADYSFCRWTTAGTSFSCYNHPEVRDGDFVDFLPLSADQWFVTAYSDNGSGNKFMNLMVLNSTTDIQSWVYSFS